MKNPTQQERGMAILQQKRGIQREEKEGDQKWEDTAFKNSLCRHVSC